MKQSIGCLMVIGLVVGAWCIAYALAPTGTILVGWTGAGLLLWWRISRKIDNPSPPPPEAPLEKEEVQVRTIEQDEHNPHRRRVVWHTEGTE